MFYKLSGSCFFYISLCNQLCNCFKLLIPLFCCVLQYDSERTHGVLLCHQVRLLQEKNETRNRQVRPIWVKKWLDPNRNKFNPFRNSCFFALYSVASRILIFLYFPAFQFAPRCGPVARPGRGGFLIVRGDAASPLCGPGLCRRFQGSHLGRANQWGGPQRTQKYLEPPCQTQNE